jgi:hypothetical protein
LFWGDVYDDACIKFKGAQSTQLVNDFYYDTICFNTFNAKSDAGIQLFGKVAHIAIFGNTFNYPGGRNGIWINYSDYGTTDSNGYHEIYNNTFYNCRMNQADDEGTYNRHVSSVFKYNIVYRDVAASGDWEMWNMDSDSNWADVDSNMYYTTSSTYEFLIGAVNHSWSQWTDSSLDVNGSYNVDPGFNNAVNGDFSRPSASGEMSQSYGGFSWTIYGAVQEAVTGPMIGANPASFSFAALEGGASPSAKSLSVFNAGKETLNWSVTADDAWLNLSPTSGTNSETVTVSVDPIAAGTYSTNITITAVGADNSPHTIPVYYTITVPDYDPPVISFEADSSLATSSTNNIVWQTDEPATSQVEYGFTAAYGHLTTLDLELVTAHSVPLTGLTADTVYHFRVISRDGSDNEAVGPDSLFRTPVQPPNLALGRPATASGTYSGYTTGVICDGVVDPFGGTSTTWVSDESSAAHWVEIDLQGSAPVSSVRIYWANNGDSSNWMRSQLITIQGWNGSTWSDLVTIDNVGGEVVTYPDTVITYDEYGTPSGFSVTVTPPGDDVTITEAGFNTVTTSRIRVFQPGSQGPATYPSIMWLTEVEVYTDDIAPPTSKL